MNPIAWVRNPPLVPLLILAAFFIGLVYSPTASYGFIWDDISLFEAADVYRNADAWRYAIYEPFLIAHNYYRPLPLLSFVAESRLHGMNPGWMHISNLFIHTLNALLVALLIKTICRRSFAHSNWLAFLGMLAYGLHYGLMELPAWISGRFDLLCTLGLLLVLLVDSRIHSHWKATPLMAAFFLLAAASKEYAAALALVLPCWHMMRAQQESPESPINWLVRQWPRYIALLVTGLAFLYWRAQIIDPSFRQVTINQEISWVPLWVLDIYVRLLAIPFAYVSPIYPKPLDHWPWALSILTALIALPCWAYRRHTSGKILPWLLLATLLSLTPVLHIFSFSLLGSFAANRYLAFPAALFTIFSALTATIMLTQNSRLLKPALGIFMLWLGASTINIATSLPMWKDPLHLWSWARANHPNSILAAHSQIHELMRSYPGKYTDSILDEALRKFPHSPDILMLSSARFISKGSYGTASKELDKLIGISLSEQQASEYLKQRTIITIESCQSTKVAMQTAEQALRLNPNLVENWLHIATAHYINNDEESYLAARNEMLKRAGEKQEKHYSQILDSWTSKLEKQCAPPQRQLEAKD